MSVLRNWSVGYPPVSATISFARAIIRGMVVGVMPSGLSMSSTFAPKARIVRIFSSAKHVALTMRSG